MGPEWSVEADSAALRANLRSLTSLIAAHAKSGQMLDGQTPCNWHVRMLENVDVPSDAYRGGYRGSAHPHLEDYPVGVGGVQAVAPRQVAGELRGFFRWLRAEVERLDQRVEAFEAEFGDEVPDAKWLDFDADLINVAARAHGEWVRIHPFANGNGRTARMIVLWLTSRYDMPPLLPLHPRPRPPYGDVARASLSAHDHRTTESYLLAEYNRQASANP